MPQLPLPRFPVPAADLAAYNLPTSAQHVHLVQELLGPSRWARTLRWLAVRELTSYNATTGHCKVFSSRYPAQRELGEFTEPLD